MAARFYRRMPLRWNKPTLGTPLNYGHPLTKYLAGAYLFNEGGGHVINYVDNVSGTFAGTTANPSHFPAEAGSGLKFNGTAGTSKTSYVNFGTEAKLQDLALGAFSIVVRAKAATPRGGFAERNDGNSIGAGWVFAWEFSVPCFRLLIEQAASNYNCTSAAITPAAGFNTYSVTFTGSLSSLSNTVFRLNGVNPGSNSGSTGSGGTLSDSANSLFISNAAFTSNGPWMGTMDWMYIFKGIALNAAEEYEIRTNPFALFALRPQAEIIAAGGPGSGQIAAFAHTSKLIGSGNYVP
jgi:hypothetical protein